MINLTRFFVFRLLRIPRSGQADFLISSGRRPNSHKFRDGRFMFSTSKCEYSPSKFLKSFDSGRSRGFFRQTDSPILPEMNEISYAIAEKCRRLITGSRIVIFSKTTCPYCTRVKKLFSTLSESPVIYELDVEPDGPHIQEYLFQTTNQRTVPNVFIHGRHIGGCDDTFKAYGDGSLQSLLNEQMEVPIEEKVDAMLRENTVVIFSKTNCPYCHKVKALFKSLGITPKVYELDQEEDGPEMQEYLHDRTKMKTVPNVFVRTNHIGGCDDTMRAFGNGSLQALLSAPSVTTPDEKILRLINENNVVIFTETSISECGKVPEIFNGLGVKPFIFIISQEIDGKAIQERLIQKTQDSTMPKIFIKGINMGDPNDIEEAHKEGKLEKMVEDDESNEIDKNDYDYDIIVIGGGSGGLAAAKEAATLGKKVALADFVVPSPMGTTWGLGGTCVNVGCIPKKLMHQAAIHAENHHDSESFGWTHASDPIQHNWEVMVENVQNYIKSLNFGYRKELNKRKVKYYNAFAEFIDSHKVKLTLKNGKVEEITGKDFIIAVGGRPAYPNIPGAREYCITSDDLFSLSKNPGKTLIIGASYIALECGGFLRGLKNDVTIMVRSILLRGFDRQIADLIGEHMEKEGVKFLMGYVPKEVIKDELGKLKVISTKNNGEEEIFSGFDTVLLAIGREACTDKLGLHNLTVKMNPKNKKIIVDNFERSSVSNIYAIGDVIDGKPELTPVAIHAGRYLGQRLAGVHRRSTNYKQVPTTVFTPLEYGTVGLSEEEAIEIFGEQNIIVYHNAFKPLEHALSRGDTLGYAKLVCVKSMDELVVGFHVLSPNAGEITQGYAIGLKLNATKKDFDDLIGIHPTCAEVFTTLNKVKNPGDRPPETSGC